MKKRTMIVPLHQKHIYQVQCSNVNKLVRRKERKKIGGHDEIHIQEKYSSMLVGVRLLVADITLVRVLVLYFTYLQQ
jgi:hypothetical protein